MNLRGERWTMEPELRLRGSGAARSVDTERFRIDLGWLRVRGLPSPAPDRLAAAYELDVDALAEFGGAMPQWLRGSGSRATGEVSCTAAMPADLDAAIAAIKATVQFAATRVGWAGFAFQDVGGSGELGDGSFTFTTQESMQLDGGPLSVSLRTDVRDLGKLPMTLQLRWRDGQVDGAMSTALRYVVPMLAGLDAQTAQLTGRCDFEVALQGPGRPAAGQTWLQWLDGWSGDGRIGLRDAAFTPSRQLAALIAPLGPLAVGAPQLGSAGKLSIDAFDAPCPVWAAENPDRALALLFVAPRDCAAVDVLVSL
jgi:hypothetical protein